MCSQRSGRVVFFYSPKGSVKLQPWSLLLRYSPGFVSFVHRGEAGGGNLQRASLGRVEDSFKALQVFPGAAGKVRDAPCPHTAILRMGKDPGIWDLTAQGQPGHIQALGIVGRGQQTQQGPTLE